MNDVLESAVAEELMTLNEMVVGSDFLEESPPLLVVLPPLGVEGDGCRLRCHPRHMSNHRRAACVLRLHYLEIHESFRRDSENPSASENQ